MEQVSRARDRYEYATYVIGIAADCCLRARRASTYHVLASLHSKVVPISRTQDLARGVFAGVVSVAAVWCGIIATCVAL